MKHAKDYLLLAGFILMFGPGSSCQGDEPALKTEEENAADGPSVEGWFFRAVSGYPVSIIFEPVVLFKNGDFFSVGEEPIETLDAGQSKRDRPAAWGTWKKEGETYYLTNYKGNTYDYRLGSGNWFPAFPYSDAEPLKESYENTSGGDYGNGMHALFKTRINFLENKYFHHLTSSGISTPGSAAWKKTSDAGTYTVSGHTIEFTYNDGSVVKMPFALGASGSPAKPTSRMIFIGGDAFVED